MFIIHHFLNIIFNILGEENENFNESLHQIVLIVHQNIRVQN